MERLGDLQRTCPSGLVITHKESHATEIETGPAKATYCTILPKGWQGTLGNLHTTHTTMTFSGHQATCTMGQEAIEWKREKRGGGHRRANLPLVGRENGNWRASDATDK